MTRFAVVERSEDEPAYVVARGSEVFAGAESDPLYGSYGRRYFPTVFPDRILDTSAVLCRGERPVMALDCNVVNGTLGFFARPFRVHCSEDLERADVGVCVKQVFKFLDRVIRRAGVEKVLIQEPNPASETSPIGVGCLARKAKARLEFKTVVDLSESEEALHAGIRKSYKSLVNRGKETLQMSFVNRETPEQKKFEAFRDFHHQVAGRSTRSDQSWMAQFETIAEGGGELALGYLLEGRLVSGTLTIDGTERSLYSTGVYDREYFDQPLGHWPVYQAVVRSKTRGMRWYDLGELPAYGGASDKEWQIGQFKKGFSDRIESLVTWEYEVTR